MDAIDKLCEILKDGKWHTLSSVAAPLQLCNTQAMQIVSFLAKYDFIHHEGNRICLKKDMLKFMNQIALAERRERLYQEAKPSLP